MAGGLFLASPAAADFAAGVRAYDSGDYEAAYREWLPLAEAGEAAAQRNLGLLHRSGHGVRKDPVEAVYWFRRAAEQGLDRAQANLAEAYLEGEGVAQSDAEAARWFELAARQGHTVAQFNLGLLYETGRGVPQDIARALGWYNLAARAGHPQALDRLSQLVQDSPGSGPQSESTNEPPRPAGERRPKGDAPTQGQTAGWGAPAPAAPGDALKAGEAAYRAADYQEALRHWLPPAKDGNARAQFLLGGLYAHGEGIPQDRVRAHMWWTLAARGGDPEAAAGLVSLVRSMSAEQVSAATAMAAQAVQ